MALGLGVIRIMNYDRFSKLELEKKGHGSAEAHALAVELSKEVQAELYELVKPHFKEIASELTKLGHDLIEASRDYPGCICFREVGEEKGRVPGLILAVDIVISAAYPRHPDHGHMENQLNELLSQAEESVKQSLELGKEEKAD